MALYKKMLVFVAYNYKYQGITLSVLINHERANLCSGSWLSVSNKFHNKASQKTGHYMTKSM